MRRIPWLQRLFIALAAFVLAGAPVQAYALDSLTAETTPSDIQATEVIPPESYEDEPGTPPVVPADETETTPTETSDETITVSNNISSQSESGAATVTNNGIAQNATSGDATAEATVLTLINAATTLDDSPAALFSMQIAGDVTGNVLLDTATLIQPNPTPTTVISADATGNDLHVINTLALAATSGDALVVSNMAAGNATTGDAQAAATIVTVVNSSIGAEQAFLGVITINGALTGDILLPASFAANTLIPSTSGTANNASNQTALTIQNNLSTTALTGNASVSDNNIAGNATTGDASTLVTVYSLINSTVTANNVLLVFVNVLGQWNGKLLDEPPGSTSAIIGGKGRNETANTLEGSTVDITVENNITVTATSGNATVKQNKAAGDATTGNAKALISMLTIANSSISSAQWFGVLFINVFGTWTGNVGIQPPPAPPAEPPATSDAPIATSPARTLAAHTTRSVNPPTLVSAVTTPQVPAVLSQTNTPKTTKQIQNSGGVNIFMLATLILVALLIGVVAVSRLSRR